MSVKKRYNCVGWLLLVGLVLGVGCQPRPQTAREADNPSNPYARVSPQAIDPSLSSVDIEAMKMPYCDLNWAMLTAGVDANDIDNVVWEELTGRAAGRAEPVKSQAGPESKKAYLRGRWHFLKNDYDKAITSFQAAVQADPNNAVLWSWLGQSRLAARQSAPGLQACYHAIKLNSDDFTNYYWLGLHFWQQGRALPAAAAFGRGLKCSSATRNNPLTAIIEMQLAVLLQQLGFDTAAIERYEACYRTLTNLAEYTHSNPVLVQMVQQIHVPLLAQAGLYLRLGYPDKAAANLRRAESLYDNQIDLLDTFINYVINQRIALAVRYSQMRVLCHYLVAEMPRGAEFILEVYYQGCEHLSQTEAYFSEVAQWHEKALLNDREYGYALWLGGQVTQARDFLESVGSDVQNDPLCWQLLAQIYGDLGQTPQMLGVYDRWAQTDISNLEAIAAQFKRQFYTVPERQNLLQAMVHEENFAAMYGLNYLLGIYARGENQPDLAQAYLRRTLDAQPDFMPAYRARFELLMAAQDYRQIIACYEALAESQPSAAPAFAAFLGQAYLNLDALDSARKIFQEILDKDPDAVDAYLALAEIFFRQRQMERAENFLLELLSRWPEEEATYKKLIVLYCHWASWQENPQFAAAAERRARGMLGRWIDLLQKRQSGREITLAQAGQNIMETLRTMHVQRPDCRITAMLLTDMYRISGETRNALDTLGTVLARFPVDRQVLGAAAELCEQLFEVERAAAYRRQLWLLDGQDPEVLQRCLAALRCAGDFTEAFALLDAALPQFGPPHYEAMEILQPEISRLAMVSRRFEAAQTIFSLWLTAVSASDASQSSMPLKQQLSLVKNYGWSLIEAGAYDAALKLMKEYPDAFKEGHYAMVRYAAQRLFWDGRGEDALQLYRWFRQRDSEDFGLLQNYAVMLKDIGQAEGALKVVREDIQGRKIEEDAWYFDVLLFLKLGFYSAALDYVDALKAQGNTDMRCQDLLLDIYLYNQYYPQADELLTQGPADATLSVKWLDRRIRLDLAQEQCEKAIDRLNSLQGRVLVHKIDELKCELYASCGQADQAIALMSRLIAERPLNKDLQQRLSGLLDQAKQTDQAIEQLEDLLAQSPGDPLLMNNLGYMFVKCGCQIDRAAFLLHQALQMDPYSPSTLDSVGWLYYRQGQFDKALPYILSAAASIDSGEYEVYDHLGDLFYRLGCPPEARLAWQKAAEALEQLVRTGETGLRPWYEAVRVKLNGLDNNRTVTAEPLFTETITDNAAAANE